jgi:hypothetical protein
MITSSSEVAENGQQAYIQLLHWLQHNVTQSWVSSKIGIGPSTEVVVAGSSSNRDNCTTTGYGVFASQPIDKGELLLVIPSKACLSFSSIITNDDDGFGQRLGSLLKVAGPGGSTVGLAGWLAKERLKMILTPSTINYNNISSFYRPYLSILPWTKEEQDHILLYTDNQIQTLSHSYPQAAEEAKALRSEVQLAKKILCPIILEYVLVGKNAPSSYYKYCKELCNQAITAAFVILLTRSFYSNSDDGEERLVPLLDMLQHNATPNIHHDSDIDGNVHVYARHTIHKGQEIYNQYAARDSMEPYQWLTRFGFIPERGGVGSY